MTLLGAFSSGLWIIPLGLFLGSAWSAYRTYIQWKSGSGGYEGNPPKWVESDEKVPLTSIGAFWFAVILLACAIGSVIWMNAEK